jgi:hypothetical protein
MDSGISVTHKVDLERMLLDASAEPTYLPLSLLQDITNCFSDEQQIGSGGFAVVYKVHIIYSKLSHSWPEHS